MACGQPIGGALRMSMINKHQLENVGSSVPERESGAKSIKIPAQAELERGTLSTSGAILLYHLRRCVISSKRHKDNRLKTGVQEISVSQRAKEIPH
jgi:hypothetical protein